MVDAAATGAWQAPSVAFNSGRGPVNDTNAGPVVPAAAALATGHVFVGEATGHDHKLLAGSGDIIHAAEPLSLQAVTASGA